MKGGHIVIPTSKKHKTIENLHAGHQGITAMQSNARVTVYWLGIDADIEDFINRCSSCLITQPNQPHNTMKPHELPDGPWQKMGVDFFKHNGQKYMAGIDYFSKFPYMCPVRNTNAQHTINHLNDILSIESAPAVLMSDNGPPFNSSEFVEFTQKWNFQYITIPQSNGQIEHTIQTLQQMLSQCAIGKARLETSFTSAQSNTYCQ